MITVASYIAKFLSDKGIKHIFGFQGSAMLKMLDAIVDKEIEYIQNFNEQASSFAADAYARVKNGIAVAIATSGPGAANLIGGIANAYFDSIPAFFITGQDYSSSILASNSARQNGFQDMDIVSIVKPITKYAVLLKNPEDIRYELEKAYYLATNGRKGSVLIDIPIDIQFKEVDENNLKGFNPPKEEKYDLKLNEVISMLENSKRPVILAGGGIRLADAKKEFDEFIKKTNIPICATLSGIDCNPDILGFSGLYGNSEANLALLGADLILALGARFSIKQTGKIKENYTNAKIIHVEIDENEINRSFLKEDVTVKADIKEFLSEINKKDIKLDINDWIEKTQEWKEKYADSVCLAQKNVDPVKLVREITKYLAKNTAISIDVGANQMWSAQALRFKDNQRLLSSSGFGAMGYSLSAAIGASYLVPAVSITGDGGFQMNLQELNTLSLRQNNVKCFIFNNNNLALMRDTQKRYYNNHFYGNNEKEFTCPDIKKLADTFNLGYERIESAEDFSKLKNIFDNNKPYLVDIIIDKDTRVLNRYDDEALSYE